METIMKIYVVFRDSAFRLIYCFQYDSLMGVTNSHRVFAQWWECFRYTKRAVYAA